MCIKVQSPTLKSVAANDGNDISVGEDENDKTSDDQKCEKDAVKIKLTEGPSQNNRKICKYYIYKKCKHGAKGKDCLFEHPQKCFKYMRNGSKNRGGCTKGKDCDYYHPTLCRNSAKTGVCRRQGCRFHHIKGTKFLNDQSDKENSTRDPSVRFSKPPAGNKPPAGIKRSSPKSNNTENVWITQRGQQNIRNMTGVCNQGEVSDSQKSFGNQQQDHNSNFLELRKQIQQMQSQIDQMLRMNSAQAAVTGPCRCLTRWN